jgi:hypothetical protein
MKFIITEEDKKHIKQLYGLITEQTSVSNVAIPPDILEYPYDEWKNWFDLNIKPFNTKIITEPKLKNRRPGNMDLSLRDSIISIINTTDDSRSNFANLLKEFNTPLTSDASVLERDSLISSFVLAQNLVNEVYSQWNDSLKKNMVLTITESTETVPGESIGGTVEFPIEWNPDTNIQLYVNNEWNLSPESIESYNQNVLSKINIVKEQFPNAIISLKSLDIQTSASRYRNTGQASDLSFQELSGYRNNSAKDYIIASLKENGVTETDTVTPTQEYLGGNGDGTTGPNPPEPNAYVDGGNVKMNTTPTEPRNQFGEPQATPEEYNQYKYLKVKIVLAATLETEETTQTTVEVFNYSLDIDGTIIPPPTPVKRPKPKGKSSSFNFRDKLARFLSINPKLCAAYNG